MCILHMGRDDDNMRTSHNNDGNLVDSDETHGEEGQCRSEGLINMEYW